MLIVICVIDIRNIDFFILLLFDFLCKTNRWPLIRPTHKTLDCWDFISYYFDDDGFFYYYIILFLSKMIHGFDRVTAMATEYVQSLIRFSLFSRL